MKGDLPMYLFLGDETNKTPNDGEFFVYGGLALSADQAVFVHQYVLDRRTQLDMTAADKVKYTSNARPDHVTVEQWRDLKSGILDALVECDATLIVYYIHHDIIKDQTIQIRNRWALEPVLYRLQMYLREVGAHGFAILDNINESELRRLDVAQIHAEGLTFDGGDPVPLDRIMGLARAHVEWSHILAANDVVLGSFAFSINQPEHPASTQMMARLCQLFWYRDEGGVRFIGDRGLIARPQNVVSFPIRARYQWLEDHLAALLNA